MKKIGLIILLVFLVPEMVLASGDVQNEAILNSLKGGQNIILQDGVAVLQIKDPKYVQIRLFDSRDNRFSKVLRITTPILPPNEWSSQVKTSISGDVQKGDTLLLVFWARSLDRKSGFAEAIFETSFSPFRKSLRRLIKLSGEWKKYYLPFRVDIGKNELNKSHDNGTSMYHVGDFQFAVNVGFKRQSIQLAGLQLVNFKNYYSVDELPNTTSRDKIYYEGMEPDASWRTEVSQRIDQVRKAPVRIIVVDQNGQPIPGAKVHVQMMRHLFRFGGSIDAVNLIFNSNDRRNANFRSSIVKMCNTVTIENRFKWENWIRPTHRLIGMQALEWADRHELGVRGHCIVWPAWDRSVWKNTSIQKRMDLAMDPQYLRSEMLSHVRDITTRLKGRVIEWDILNEPTFKNDILKIIGDDAIVEWFEAARSCDPDVPLYINECDVIDSRGIEETAAERNIIRIGKKIQEKGSNLLGGIGLQCHMKPPFPSPQAVLRKIDRISRALKVPICITEFTMVGVSDEVQKCYINDFMTTVFSHPHVNGFLVWWLADYQEGPGPIYDNQMKLLPTGEVYEDLVFHKWWTDENTETDLSGEINLRAFKGKYRITVSVEGRDSIRDIDISEQGVNLTVPMICSRR